MPLPFIILLLLIAWLLQSSFLELIAVAGVKPDLVMLIIVLYGFLLGPKEGAFLGYAGGLVEDFIFGQYIGLSALSNMVAGYLAGVAGERLYRENILVASMVTFFATLAGFLVNYLLLYYLGLHVSSLALVRVVLPAAVYTSILAPFLFGRIFRYLQVRGKDF